MTIDEKPPSEWLEQDLRELGTQHRREGPRLDSKRTLSLDTRDDKAEAEHDAQAMANGGGEIIIYGIAEVELPDGTVGADELSPLRDGTLYERLNSVLDDRGQPRLVFDLHAIDANDSGMYLVLEVSGRRRPHQAQNGRYYGRRGTSSRRMDEAEIREAYRDALVREAITVQPLLREEPSTELPASVLQRVHRGLKPHELALRADEAGVAEPPGWLSVLVLPDPPRPLLDPIRDRDRFDAIDIPDRWDGDHVPLQYFDLRPTQDGLHAQLPPSEEFPPSYLVSMYRDGVMEYGTTLEPALRREEPAENRIIFSASHTFQVHDYLQAFAVALGDLGYEGSVAAHVSFDHTQGVMLGIEQGRDLSNPHPIEEDHVRGELWRMNRQGLLAEAGRITKDVMDRVFLAAGVRTGCWLIDERGRLVKR